MRYVYFVIFKDISFWFDDKITEKVKNFWRIIFLTINFKEGIKEGYYLYLQINIIIFVYFFFFKYLKIFF